MTIGDPPGKGRTTHSRSDRQAARGPPLKVPPARTGFPVVALGASAGGLEAFSKLFDALPADIGMAFILIQHLDPTHASLMVDLLAAHTKMKVQQAASGMPLESGHVYIIPPAMYLSIKAAALHLSEPPELLLHAPVCRSTFSCVHWRRSMASARCARFSREPAPTEASG